MDRIRVDGGELEARIGGVGEPLLLIHGSLIGDAYECLRSQPVLAGKYQLISYSRRGFRGSVRHAGAFSIAQQARDAAAVLGHYGVARAHVAGHSYGGAIALELHRQSPRLVHSLAMFEPAGLDVPSAAGFFEAVGPIAAAYEGGDFDGALRNFIGLVFSEPNWKERIEPHLPGDYWHQCITDIATFFEVEIPALGEWAYGAADAAAVKAPVLSLLGVDSSVFFVEGQALMKKWWPAIETTTLPGASHNLQFANPLGAATALAAFLAKHPMKG